MAKKTQPRPLDAILSDYATTCARLGEITFKRRAMEEEAESLHAHLGALNLEADAAKKSTPTKES